MRFFGRVEKVVGIQTMSRSSAQSKRGGVSQYRVPIQAVGTVLVADLLVLLVAIFAIGGEAGDIFLQTVLFPLAAFVGGFFALVATRHVVACLLASIVVHTLLYGIAMGFSLAAILWIILYLLSGFVGLSIAYIVITHKS